MIVSTNKNLSNNFINKFGKMITPDATSYGDENEIVSKESIFSMNGKEEDKKYEKETKDKINSITEMIINSVNQNTYKKELEKLFF